MTPSSQSRLPPKPIVAFLVQAALLFLAIGYWPTPREAYPALFHAQANALLAHLDSPHVRLQRPAADAELQTDTVMVGAPRRGAPEVWRSYFGVRRIGWWPSASLLAMLLVTPLAPVRRAVAIVAGLVLVHVFTLARIGVEIAYASYELARGPGAAASGPVHLLLRIGSESLTATIPSAAIVFLAWVLVASPRQTIDLTAARRWISAGGRRAPPTG